MELQPIVKALWACHFEPELCLRVFFWAQGWMLQMMVHQFRPCYVYLSWVWVLLWAQGWTLQLMVRRASLELPEFAADAEVFRPERWLNERGCPFIREPKGFMPWGDGPRKCLGMPLAKTELRVCFCPWLRDAVHKEVSCLSVVCAPALGFLMLCMKRCYCLTVVCG